MHPILYFWIAFLVLLAIFLLLDLKYCLLRDSSTTLPKPYSYARVQLAWWTLVILSSIIAILLARNEMPTLDSSTLILLGITAGTTVVARMIDVSDRTSPKVDVISQDFPGESFLLDILSDKNGVSIHRLQSVIINVIFGVWFIAQVLRHLSGVSPCMPGDTDCASHPLNYFMPVISNNNLILLGLSSGDCANHPLNYFMPVISNNNLILLGLSSGTYAALKTTENKAGA
jgi:hypothetical protein